MIFGVSLAAPLALAYPALADNQFMNINFDGDTIASQPATNTTVTYPITQPYAIGGYDPDPDPNNGAYESPPTPADGTILVGDAPGISKGAILTTDPGNNQIGALWMDTEYNQSSQVMKLSFDLNVLNAPSALTAQTKFLNGNPADPVGILLGVNSFQSGNSGFDFAAAPTSSSGGVFGVRTADNTGLTSFFNYTNGDSYHIELDANYSTGTVDAYVNGTLEESGAPMQSGIVPGANPDETFIFLNGQPGDANSVAIDNIEASVPEPASLGLLAIGGGALLMRRRKCPA
jgi:hypothetical protein